MANNDWDDDFDGDSGDDQETLPKKLRAQIKAQQKRIAELEARDAELSKKVRTSDVKSILKEVGAPQRIARYALADLDEVTPDSVKEWLKENGDDFGINLEDGAGTQTQQSEAKGMSAEELVAMNAINQFRDTSNGAQTGLDEAQVAITNATSEADILAAAKAALNA